MARVHYHYMKIVLFLFIFSQVRGDSSDSETKLQELKREVEKYDQILRDVNFRDIEYYPFNEYLEIYFQLVVLDKKILLKLTESYPEIVDMRERIKYRVHDLFFNHFLDNKVIGSGIGFVSEFFMISMMFSSLPANPEFWDYVAKELLPKDPETVNKISSMTDQIRRIQDIIIEHNNNVTNEFISKTQPIIKAIIKNVGDSILTLFPDKKNETMSTNINHNINESTIWTN